jgi:hypothetical protein
VNIPQWAQGEGWRVLEVASKSMVYAVHDLAQILVASDGTLEVGHRIFEFSTPEDARKVADMLITGKVQV